MSTTNLSHLRSAWRKVSRVDDPVLRISLLASYTIDQLVPYLGMALHDAELPADISVGPFDQIMRQCLDDDGAVASARPDVLVVAPRFEELGADRTAWASDLADLAAAAVGTVARWSGCLVFVLPALPESRSSGVGDAGLTAGVVAEATRARETARARLGGRPNVYLADAEDSVRTVGSHRAHHPAMFRLARVPYTEELFACLGAQLARIVRVRHGSRHRAAVIDADSLLPDDDATRALREPLLDLHAAGMLLAIRGSRADQVWASLAAALPELVTDLVAASTLDERAVPEQLDAIAATLGTSRERIALLTADRGVTGGSVVLLGDRPESWAAELRAAGLFDRQAPPVLTTEPVPEPGLAPVAEPAPTSLADFVHSLDVSVEFHCGDLDKVAEVVERAKDFTLGIRHDAAAVTARADEITAIMVRDRYGDYGVSGAIALHTEHQVCTVDLFSLSCPVLGRQVEDAVLGEILRRAEEADCTDVVFRFEQTPHNGVAVRFVESAAGSWPVGGRQVHVHAGALAAPPAAKPVVPFGVVAFGTELPEQTDVDTAAPEYTADLDRIQGWEYRRFHRAADGVGITDLAVAAGERALAEAGVPAGDVDLVVLAISDIAEYLYWDPAAATQARLGASRAEALLVNQACGGGVAAFDLVAGKFSAHPAYQTALIIGANRVCEPYWNRMEINTSIFSDGAAAAVVRRDHGTCRWLATEIITDGQYADFMRMETGGAAQPFSAGSGKPRVRSPLDRLDEFFEGDVRRMFSFVSTIRARNREVVDAACARARVDRSEIRRIIHFNDNAKQLAELAKDLGMSLEQTNVDVAVEHGHIGCADQLLTLHRLLATGDLAAGDLVALTSTGSGMQWICTLLRV